MNQIRNIALALCALAAYLWACNQDYEDTQLAQLARNIEVPVLGQLERPCPL